MSGGGGPPFLSSNASPYNLQLSGDVAAAAGGQNLNPGGVEFAAAPDLTNGLAPASTYKYGSGRPNTFNFNQFSLSFPSSERWGGYAYFEHKVCEDQVVIYGDFMYQNVQAHNELAPPATQLSWPEKLSYADRLRDLPEWRDPDTGRNAVEYFDSIVSRQQPDDGSE